MSIISKVLIKLNDYLCINSYDYSNYDLSAFSFVTNNLTIYLDTDVYESKVILEIQDF